jgi:hypothetical protein
MEIVNVTMNRLHLGLADERKERKEDQEIYSHSIPSTTKIKIPIYLLIFCIPLGRLAVSLD